MNTKKRTPRMSLSAGRYSSPEMQRNRGMSGLMSRRAFLGTAAVGMGAAMIGASGVVHAKGRPDYDVIVDGRNDPWFDLPNVQEAVDQGGKILLRGDFDFGWSGSINIWQGIEIVGENATIYNGFDNFFVYAPESDIIIRGADDNNRLTFVGGAFFVIDVWDWRNLTVDKVNINGVWSVWGYKVGIIAAPAWWQWPYIGADSVSITDCTVDLVGDDGSGNPICPYTDDPNNVAARCIWIANAIGLPEKEVDIIVKNNTVSNAASGQIVVTDIAGTVQIEGNTCSIGEVAAEFVNPNDPNDVYGGSGISTAQHDLTPPGQEPIYEPDWIEMHIINNTIEAVPKNKPDGTPFTGYSWGILASREADTIIKKNQITSSTEDIHPILVDKLTEAYVGQNNLSGTALDGGIVILDSTDSVFAGNNLTDLTSIPTYYLDETTADNTVRGHSSGSDSVIDLGTDNFITGVTRMSGDGSIGEQMSGAIQAFYANTTLPPERDDPDNRPQRPLQ